MDVVSHDWWLYIVNELSDGKTLYDKESTILYRQHKGSLIGNNTTFLAKMKRLWLLLKGVYRDYNSRHLLAFNMASIPSSKDNIHVIDDFFILRVSGLVDRIQMINKLGIYRQTWDTHLALYLGAIFRKL